MVGIDRLIALPMAVSHGRRPCIEFEMKPYNFWLFHSLALGIELARATRRDGGSFDKKLIAPIEFPIKDKDFSLNFRKHSFCYYEEEENKWKCFRKLNYEKFVNLYKTYEKKEKVSASHTILWPFDKTSIRAKIRIPRVTYLYGPSDFIYERT